MTLSIRCPNPTCGKFVRVAEDRTGQAVSCLHCRTTFRVPAGSGATGEAGSSPRQIGRFEIRDLLGRGAFGTVYRAHDPQLDREVALKVARPETLDSPDRVTRFLREGRTAANLQHPHIVPVYDAGVDGAHHYIATAYIAGRTLADAIAGGALDFRRTAGIVRDLAAALAYAHVRGVVHRDIKPANVLLGENDHPYLTDFGLARREDGRTRLTRLGAILGTPAYMAPEQAAGQSGDSQSASDQYSLGVVLYELLCGRTPFGGPPEVVLFNVLERAPPAPRKVNPAVPAELEAICLKAMARRPQERYAGCQEFADALRRWLEQAATVPPVAQGIQHVGRPLSSSPALVAAAPLPGNPLPQVGRAATNPPVAPRHRGSGVLLVGGMLVVLVGVGVLLLRGLLSSADEDKREPQPELPLIRNSIGMKFARIPAGSAWLGGGGGKPGTNKVTIPQAFDLGIYPVTQGQWQTIMGNNPSWFARAGGGKENVKDVSDAELMHFPVEQVSWEDVQEFLKKLNEHEKESGWSYRLPTNVEWEYACRGGPVSRELSAFDFYCNKPTNDLSSEQANFNGNRPAGSAAKGKYLERTSRVGQYPANALGLHDMHGNVFQWCADLSPPGGSDRANRGGSWLDDGSNCRAANHYRFPPAGRSSNLGFRVARVPSGKSAIPIQLKPALSSIPKALGMKFVRIPAGSAWLGGGGGKPGTNKVTIAQPFYLGVYPVTQAQWQAVMKTNPSYCSRGGLGKARVKEVSDADLKDFPVEQISWNEVQEFLVRLNAREKASGWLYRLPSEAEWEYACRGGPVSEEVSAYHFYFAKPTNNLSSEQANFDGNHPAGSAGKGKYLGRSTRVGQYPPNALGLHDMHGNVWQWCADLYAPEGPARALRGGGWNAFGVDCTAANRGPLGPGHAGLNAGFRVLAVPSGKSTKE